MSGESSLSSRPTSADERDVSVVIPCHGAAHFLADALDSVLRQRGARLDVHVVDDGSPDGDRLGEVVDSFRDAGAPIHLHREPHRGVGAARNAGLAAVRSSRVAFLDADDRWRPGFLRAQLELLDGEVDLVWCDAAFFGPAAAGRSTVMHTHPSEGEPTLAALLAGRCVPVMSTVVARTAAVRRAGGFATDLDACEDFELWVRLVADGARLAWTTRVGAERRLHARNRSRDTRRMVRAQLEVIRRWASRISADHPLHPAVVRRREQLAREFQLARARDAIAAGDAEAARMALWEVVRNGGRAKHALGALALRAMPRTAVRVLSRRLDPSPAPPS